MRVMGVQENRMLSFSWNAPPHCRSPQATHFRDRPAGARRRGGNSRAHHAPRLGDGGQWDQTHAYFDRAWGNVLANLQKRFADGPVDWTPWLARLKAMQEEEARKKAQ